MGVLLRCPGGRHADARSLPRAHCRRPRGRGRPQAEDSQPNSKSGDADSLPAASRGLERRRQRVRARRVARSAHAARGSAAAAAKRPTETSPPNEGPALRRVNLAPLLRHATPLPPRCAGAHRAAVSPHTHTRNRRSPRRTRRRPAARGRPRYFRIAALARQNPTTARRPTRSRRAPAPPRPPSECPRRPAPAIAARRPRSAPRRRATAQPRPKPWRRRLAAALRGRRRAPPRAAPARARPLHRGPPLPLRTAPAAAAARNRGHPKTPHTTTTGVGVGLRQGRKAPPATRPPGGRRSIAAPPPAGAAGVGPGGARCGPAAACAPGGGHPAPASAGGEHKFPLSRQSVTSFEKDIRKMPRADLHGWTGAAHSSAGGSGDQQARHCNKPSTTQPPPAGWGLGEGRVDGIQK